MHHALLVDEILRQIFHFASKQDRTSLVYAARTCKAWKDPALDFIWNRLSSLEPLILLLPGISINNNEYDFYNCHLSTHDLHVFDSYARRIKHLSNRQETKIYKNGTIPSSFCPLREFSLPNLKTVHISVPRCNMLLLPLSLSQNLLRLDIDLGFKQQASNVDLMLCEYLEGIKKNDLGLRHISLRGLASKRMNAVISSLRNVESLSLRLGHSLLNETLHAIMTFPLLLELEIHAGHLEINSLDELERDAHFVSLSKLHIRAKSSLVENLMHHIQPNTLYHLHIELENASPSTVHWSTVFSSICSRTSNTLRHLALEHHFEIPEPTLSMPSDSGQTAHRTQSPISSILFETIQTLRSLKLLSYFSCDVTLPVVILDQDIEKLVMWWPDLEYLELGSDLQTEEQVNGSTNTTTASLGFFSSKCPKLRKLILPLTIDDQSIFSPPTQTASQLCNLTISQLRTSNPEALAGSLRSLFPLLEELEGPCDDTQPWIDTENALRTIYAI